MIPVPSFQAVFSADADRSTDERLPPSPAETADSRKGCHFKPLNLGMACYMTKSY